MEENEEEKGKGRKRRCKKRGRLLVRKDGGQLTSRRETGGEGATRIFGLRQTLSSPFNRDNDEEEEEEEEEKEEVQKRDRSRRDNLHI